MSTSPGADRVPDPSEDRAALWQLRRGARRLAWVYAAAALVLMPWIVYLAITLPKRDLDTHYRAAWVGFDILLVFVITRTAYLAFRMDPRVQLPATATATLLIVDAWFDITTAGGRGATAEAIVLAIFFEIPAAIFSMYVAYWVASHELRLAHLERLTEDADPPAGDREQPSAVEHSD
ncbi:MAG: hypothetical protein WB565_06115 [Acidimicrobiales bacterium]